MESDGLARARKEVEILAATYPEWLDIVNGEVDEEA
jgi:hypothetical protein